jgi:hypothetical protein
MFSPNLLSSVIREDRRLLFRDIRKSPLFEFTSRGLVNYFLPFSNASDAAENPQNFFCRDTIISNFVAFIPKILGASSPKVVNAAKNLLRELPSRDIKIKVSVVLKVLCLYSAADSNRFGPRSFLPIFRQNFPFFGFSLFHAF